MPLNPPGGRVLEQLGGGAVRRARGRTDVPRCGTPADGLQRKLNRPETRVSMNGDATARRLASMAQPVSYSELHSPTISRVKPPCVADSCKKDEGAPWHRDRTPRPRPLAAVAPIG